MKKQIESPRVSIIIPNWNGKNLLERNLPIILKAKDHKKNKIVEVIVIDDKSQDNSVDFLKKNYSDRIRLVQHRINRGFSAAVNTGARSAKGNLLCLLNTDVVPSENFIEATLPHFKNPKVFAVSLHEEGYTNAIGKFHNGFIEHSPGKARDSAQVTFWVNGGSGIFRRDYWMKLGGLDEKILPPFYWEDLDLGYRAQKRGYELLWEPKALVIHKHEATINQQYFKKRKMDLIKERNQLLMIWKNITSARLMKKHIRGLLKRLFTHFGYFRVVIAALLKLRLVLKAREKERKESIVSDEAVLAKFN